MVIWSCHIKTLGLNHHQVNRKTQHTQNTMVPFLVVVVVVVLTTLLVVRVFVVIFFIMASSVSWTSTCSPALQTLTFSFVLVRFSMLVRIAVPVFSSVESITFMSLFSSSFDSSEMISPLAPVLGCDDCSFLPKFKWLLIFACNSAWLNLEFDDWREYGFCWPPCWDDWFCPL